MAHTVVHFEIPANDPEQLADFYRRLFDWNIEKAPGMDYWLLNTVDEGQPGANGGMMKRQNPQQSPLNYYGVESVEEFSRKVQSLGGTVVVPKQAVPQIGYFAICLDPDGNQFALFEDDRNAA